MSYGREIHRVTRALVKVGLHPASECRRPDVRLGWLPATGLGCFYRNYKHSWKPLRGSDGNRTRDHSSSCLHMRDHTLPIKCTESLYALYYNHCMIEIEVEINNFIAKGGSKIIPPYNFYFMDSRLLHLKFSTLINL